MQNRLIASIIIAVLMATSSITYARETACGYDDIPIAIDYELVTLKAGTLFGLGKSNLTPAGLAELERVMSKIKDAQLKGKILVTGHTCNIGSDEYNQALSVDRANSVTRYLIKHGISGEHVLAEGKGETSPIATNENEKGRILNRRVEISLRIQMKSE